MALIKCPECGREISDRAKNCINCGCLIETLSRIGKVKIKMPNNIVVGLVGLVASRRAVVTDLCGRELWSGQHGQTAIFEVNGPTKVFIELGGLANKVVGIVNPHCKYALIQDMGIHMFATYRLSEVEVIDAE